jgi:hypothetical protein
MTSAMRTLTPSILSLVVALTVALAGPATPAAAATTQFG